MHLSTPPRQVLEGAPPESSNREHRDQVQGQDDEDRERLGRVGGNGVLASVFSVYYTYYGGRK